MTRKKPDGEDYPLIGPHGEIDGGLQENILEGTANNLLKQTGKEKVELEAGMIISKPGFGQPQRVHVGIPDKGYFQPIDDLSEKEKTMLHESMDKKQKELKEKAGEEYLNPETNPMIKKDHD